MPLQVYLDSKDISIMADRERPDAHQDAVKVYEFLINKVAEGSVEIRLSFFHVAELLPRHPQYADAAQRRAKVAKDLSRNKSLLFFEKLHVIDMVSYLKEFSVRPKKTFPMYAFSDEGNWLPDITSDDFNIKSFVKREILNYLKEFPVSRQQQRQAYRKIFSSDGNLTSLGRSLISENRQSLLDELRKNYPLTQKFYDADYAFKLFTGKVSEEEFEMELFAGMRDLENLSGWMYEKSEHAQAISDKLYSQGKGFSEKMKSMREGISRIYEMAAHAGLSERDAIKEAKKHIDRDDIRNRIIHSIADENKTEIRRLSKIYDFSDSILSSQFGSLPFVDSMLTTMHEFYVDRVFQSKNQAKLSHSDYTDIQHCGYAPYVDVFSCDRRTAQYLKFTKERYKTTIVDNFSKIINSIQAQIDENASNKT